MPKMAVPHGWEAVCLPPVIMHLRLLGRQKTTSRRTV